MTGWIFRHVHHLGVHERLRDGDVDIEGAEGEVVTDGWHRPLAETTCVVKDQMLRAESLHQSRAPFTVFPAGVEAALPALAAALP